MGSRRLRSWLVAAAGVATLAALAPASTADVTIGAQLTPNPPSQGTCAFGNPANRPCVIVITGGSFGEAMTSPCNGTVTRWRINGIPRTNNTYRLRVVRSNGDGTFTGQATSEAVDIDIDGVNEYPTSLPISTGDYIGLDFQQSSDEGGVRYRFPGSQSVFYAFPADGTPSNSPNFLESTYYLFNADVACTPTGGGGGAGGGGGSGGGGGGGGGGVTPPNNSFTLKAGKKCPHACKHVVVDATVPGPGIVRGEDAHAVARGGQASAKITLLVKPKSKTATKAGKVTLKLKLTKAAKKKIKKKSTLKLKLRVTYTPTGGAANSKTTSFKLKRAKKKKKRH